VLPGFDRRYLHRTAANFAIAIGALHSHGLVVGDLNESNVLVRPNALVTMIDTDSYQVPNLKGRQPLIFPCPVGKTEFTPPELQGKPFAGTVRTPEHDRFALAVLIFLLLMEGSHPFRASWLGAGEPPSTDQKISHGLFPHAQPPPAGVAPPPGLPPLAALHPAIADLMRRCFVDGHKHPAKRPLPADWERALSEGERALVRCPNGHYYGGHLRSCSWCERPVSRPPVAVPRAAREEREAPRRPTPPLLPAPTVRPVPTTVPPPRPGRGAWRSAMMASVTATVIIVLVALQVMGALTPPNGTTLPFSGPVENDEAYDLQPGDHVRVSSGLRDALLYDDPDEPTSVKAASSTILEIDGPWKNDRLGRIWWPVRDPRTGAEGYILQMLLEPIGAIR
jgi:DNA-binding helix-hairpin-helix protein with protein kinase domain